MLLPSYFTLSGRDAWIAILFAVPIGLFFSFVMFRLHGLNPKLTLIEMIDKAFGRLLGRCLSLGLLLYFFYISFITFYALFDFISNNFLPTTPRWAIAAIFYLLVLYAIYLGVESITRVSEGLFLIIIFTGTSLALITQVDKDYSLLFPLFEEGFLPVWKGILLTSALYGEMILLLMIAIKKDYSKAKSFLFTNIIIVLLVTIMSLGTVTGTLMIFGLEHVKLFEYPALREVRYGRFGFFERYDIYGLVLMIFGSAIRISIFQTILQQGIKQWTGWAKGKLIHGMIILGLFYVTFFLIQNYRLFSDFYIATLYPLTAFISIGIPFLTWIALEMRNRLKVTDQGRGS